VKSILSVLALGLTLVMTLTTPMAAEAGWRGDDDDRKHRRNSWSWTDRDFWRGGGHRWDRDAWREAREERRERRRARFDRIRAHANECSELLGGTRGLFGLCVRYCAAQNCIDVAGEDAPRACAMGAPHYLERYNARKSASDPEMPCIKQPEESSCPCWTDGELAALRTPGDQDVASCGMNVATSSTGIKYDWDIRPEMNNPESFVVEVSAFEDYFGSGPVCRLTDSCTNGNCSGLNRVLQIDESELAACQQSAQAAAAARNLACD